MSKEKLIILFTVFVDVLGIGIVIPILPFYVQEFGSSPTTVTFLFSTFSLFAFLSSPWLGALSDRIGRRPVMIGSIISTAIGWFVFAGATTIHMLFIGRIIDGIAAGNLSIAQSTLVDIAKDEKERTQNLGIMGAAFGVGFMVGPFIGGLLSTFSHSAPFWFTGGLALVNAVVAYFVLPETHHDLNTEGRLSANRCSGSTL
jgi:multidrug resistance protein